MSVVSPHNKIDLDMPSTFMKANKRKWTAARDWGKQSGGVQTTMTQKLDVE